MIKLIHAVLRSSICLALVSALPTSAQDADEFDLFEQVEASTSNRSALILEGAPDKLKQSIINRGSFYSYWNVKNREYYLCELAPHEWREGAGGI